MTLPSHVPLVVATRNAHVERIHWGSVAVVDATGALLAHGSDPLAWVFSRSTLKPFQALPFVRDGGPDHFGFTDAELALACASRAWRARRLPPVRCKTARTFPVYAIFFTANSLLVDCLCL
jgi:L-asparaginase II